MIGCKLGEFSYKKIRCKNHNTEKKKKRKNKKK